jgi:hypothetical protein
MQMLGLFCSGGVQLQDGQRMELPVKITTTPLLHVTALQLRADVLDATPGLLIASVNCGVAPVVPGKKRGAVFCVRFAVEIRAHRQLLALTSAAGIA